MEEKLDEFCSVTGATRERARFFLEASEWNVQSAVGAFYEEEHEESVSEIGSGQAGDGGRAVSATKSGVATLSDYQSSQSGAAGDDDDSEKFFAGGSEHSGQMIAGPPRKKRDVAEEVFVAARRQGATPVDDDVKQSTKPAMFHGTGFRLGNSEAPSEVIAGPSLKNKPQKVSHTLTFWKDGFSVDSGPLRDGQSAEDQRFLQSVSRGEIPQELVHAAQGGEVDINIEDRRTEHFVPPKVKVVAFSGAGHKLGNLTPEVTTVASQPPPPSTSVVVDPGQPVTSVQIRLADGSRLQGKFNHNHTVGDIRRFIITSRPEMANKTFVLMTTFPNRALTDTNASLADAQLLNAVVVQRIQ